MPVPTDPFVPNTKTHHVEMGRVRRVIDQVIEKSYLATASLTVIIAVFTGYMMNPPPVYAVRVHGGPLGQSETSTWRISLLSYQDGVFSPAPDKSLTLHLQNQTLYGKTDRDGAWEAVIARSEPLPSYVSITLGESSQGREIVELVSNLIVEEAAWKLQPVAPSIRCMTQRLHPNPVQLSVRAQRDLAATGFAEFIKISIKINDRSWPFNIVSDVDTISGDRLWHHSTPWCRVQLDASHATWKPVAPKHPDTFLDAVIRFTPRFSLATLQLDAHCSSTKTVLHTNSPMGGMESDVRSSLHCEMVSSDGLMWIDPDALIHSNIVVRSPVGHREAYVSVVSKKTRNFAKKVTLISDGTASSHAAISLRQMDPSGELSRYMSADSSGSWLHDSSRSVPSKWISVSPDPPSGNIEQTAWPFTNALSSWPAAAVFFSTPVLVDTTKLAQAKVRQYRQTSRVLPTSILSLGALLQAFMFVLRAQRFRKQTRRQLLETDMQAGYQTETAWLQLKGMRWWSTLAVSSFLISLGLAALALLLWMRA